MGLGVSRDTLSKSEIMILSSDLSLCSGCHYHYSFLYIGLVFYYCYSKASSIVEQDGVWLVCCITNFDMALSSVLNVPATLIRLVLSIVQFLVIALTWYIRNENIQWIPSFRQPNNKYQGHLL